MAQKNKLYTYRDEHYGKMFVKRPEKLIDTIEKARHNSLWNNGNNFRVMPYDLFVLNGSSFDTSSFYTREEYGKDRFGQQLYSLKYKKLSLTLLEEYEVKSAIGNFKENILKFLCIFPEHIKVPPHIRTMQFYGKKEWFKEYKTSKDEFSSFISSIKQKYVKK